MICLFISLVFVTWITASASPVKEEYTIIVDAGSTGSRMYIYKWSSIQNLEGSLPDVQLAGDVSKVDGALSDQRITEIPAYISELLDRANNRIPTAVHAQTPLYIMATGGMRTLDSEMQEVIWKIVREHIKQNYKFEFDDSYAYTISGVEEGFYGWISINYVAQRFSLSTSKSISAVQPTFGMLDLGGASLQIAYEVPTSQDIPDDLFMEFVIEKPDSSGYQKYKVYVSSYLYYGVTSIRERYEQYLLNWTLNKASDLDVSKPIEIQDYCLMKGYSISNSQVSRLPDTFGPINADEKRYSVNYVGNGQWSNCRKLLQNMFLVSSSCSTSCGIAGVFQPTIDFSKTTFYGLTEFDYIFKYLELSDGYNYKSAESIVGNLLSKSWSEYEKELQAMYSNDPEQIKHKMPPGFKPAYVISLLKDGLKFPDLYKNFKTTSKVNGKEASWTLGALVNHLSVTESKNRRKPWLILLIVLLCIALLFLLLGLIVAVLLCRRRRKARDEAIAASEFGDVPMGVNQNYIQQNGAFQRGVSVISKYNNAPLELSQYQRQGIDIAASNNESMGAGIASVSANEAYAAGGDMNNGFIGVSRYGGGGQTGASAGIYDAFSGASQDGVGAGGDGSTRDAAYRSSRFVATPLSTGQVALVGSSASQQGVRKNPDFVDISGGASQGVMLQKDGMHGGDVETNKFLGISSGGGQGGLNEVSGMRASTIRAANFVRMPSSSDQNIVLSRDGGQGEVLETSKFVDMPENSNQFEIRGVDASQSGGYRSAAFVDMPVSSNEGLVFDSGAAQGRIDTSKFVDMPENSSPSAGVTISQNEFRKSAKFMDTPPTK